MSAVPIIAQEKPWPLSCQGFSAPVAWRFRAGSLIIESKNPDSFPPGLFYAIYSES
jgi:hypothetical protein